MNGSETAVIALGGNALSPAGEHCTIAEQFAHTRESLGAIVDLALDGWDLCLVHGNGPQVGDELVRNELARDEVSPLPLGVLVAATAGWIGYMIQQSLENALRLAGSDRDVATVITQIRVAPNDPALSAPTKFIGHGIPEARVQALLDRGVAVKKDARGRYRRVVGSPAPVAVHEVGVIRRLVQSGTIVTAARTLADALGARGNTTESTAPIASADFRTAAEQLYARMSDAMRRGDWVAFGHAYDALGALLNRARKQP
jgi:carbamate kinase